MLSQYGTAMLSNVMFAPHRDRARLAIIAHDGKKADLVAFATFNRDRLALYELIATGATGDLLRDKVGLEVEGVTAGPHGGDVQIASRVVEGEVDAGIFVVGPLDKHPHDADLQTLLRICSVGNVPPPALGLAVAAVSWNVADWLDGLDAVAASGPARVAPMTPPAITDPAMPAIVRMRWVGVMLLTSFSC